MSNSLEKQALLQSAGARKENTLSPVANQKQQSISPDPLVLRSAANTPPTLEAYEALHGPASAAVANEYAREQDALQRAIARNNLRQIEQRAIESGTHDAELNTAWGTTQQIRDNLLLGAQDTGRRLSTLAPNLRATLRENELSDEAYEAYAAQEQYQAQRNAIGAQRLRVQSQALATGEDPRVTQNKLSLLDQAEAKLVPPSQEQLAALEAPVPRDPNDYTNRPQMTQGQLVKQLRNSKTAAQAIDQFFDEDLLPESIVNAMGQQRLQEDWAETYTKYAQDLEGARDNVVQGNFVRGVAQGAPAALQFLFEALGDSVRNPNAAAELIARNAGDLALGAISPALMAGSNLGYGLDTYQKGIEAYAEEHDGALPSREDAQAMLAWSLGAAAGEQILDRSLLGSLTPSKSARKAFDKALKDSRRSAGVQFLRNEAGRLARVGQNTLGEGVTEGFQTLVEEELSQGNFDPSTFDIEQAAMGAAAGATVGGGISATGATVQRDAELLRTLVRSGDKVARRGLQEAEKRRVQGERKRAAKAESEAKYKEAEESGDISEIVDSADPEYDMVKTVGTMKKIVANKDIPEETRDEVQDIAIRLMTEREEVLEDYTAQLDQIDKNDKSPENQKKHKELVKAADTARKEYDKALTTLAAMRTDVAPKAEELESLRSVLAKETPEPEELAIASQRIISSMQRTPDAIPLDLVEALESKANLAPEQRQFVSDFKASQQVLEEAKDARGVRKDMIHGGPGFAGLNQYRERVHAGVNSGNQSMVRKQLENLRKWSEHQRAKADQVREAFAPYQAALDQQVNPKSVRLTQEQRAAIQQVKDNYVNDRNEPLRIHSGTPTWLVQAMETEARAMEAVYRELSNVASQGRAKAVEAPVVEATPKAVDARPEPVKKSSPRVPEPPIETQVEESEPVQDDSPFSDDAQDVPADIAERFPRTTQETVQEAVQAEPESAPADTSVAAEEYDLPSKLVAGTQEDAEVTTPEQATDNFFRTNQVLRWLTPRKREGKAKQSALHRLRNLPKVLATNRKAILPFTTDGVISDAADKLVDDYLSVHDKMAATFRRTFNKLPVNRRHNDYLQYLLAEDGTLDSNVLAAMTASAYNWLGTRAGGLVYNSDGGVNSILGRAPDTAIKPEERWLHWVGMNQSVLAESLGRDAMQTLGLTGGKSAPKNIEANLARSMGTYIVTMLLDNGYLVREDFDPRELYKNKEKRWVDALVKKLGDDTTIPMVRPPMQTKMENGVEIEALAESIEEIVEHHKDATGFWTDLFDTPNHRTGPELEMPKGTTSVRKGTRQKVSKQEKQLLDKHQKQPWSVKPSMSRLFDQLDLLTWLGIMDIETDPKKLHKANRDGNKGEIQQVERDIRYFQELKDSLEDPEQKLYFRHEVVRQGRIHMVSNTVNPQASKIHRHLLRKNQFVQKIDFGSELMNDFYLALGQALGVDIDKQSAQKSIEQVKATIESPEIQGAVAVLAEVLGGKELTPEQKLDLLAGVKKGGKAAHSLDGLMALAEMQQALDQGASSFETDLFVEIDGVTNGPIIGGLQFAVRSTIGELKRFLNKGGLFYDGTATSLAEWQESPANLDSYKEIGSHWFEALKTKATEWQTKAAEGKGKEGRDAARKVTQLAVTRKYFPRLMEMNDQGDSLVVSRKGRKFSKNPLMVTVYGSGAKAVKRSVGEAFVGLIYEKFETIVNNAELSEEEQYAQIREVLDDINLLSGSELSIDMLSSPQDILNKELNKAATESLIQAAGDTYGETVVNAVNHHYEGFKDNRKVFNESMSVINAIFVEMFTAKRKALIEQLVKEGKIPQAEYQKKNQPKEIINLYELSQAQEESIMESLLDTLPILHTVYSKANNDLNEGIFVGKTSEERVQDRQLSTEVRLGNPVTYTTPDGEQKPLATFNTSGSRTSYADTGVGPAIMGIHNLDAYVALQVQGNWSVLGVHDGFAARIGEYRAVGQALNQAFEEGMGHSLVQEIKDQYERSLSLLEQYAQDTGDSAIRDRVIQRLRETTFIEKDNLPDIFQFQRAANQALADHVTGLKKRALQDATAIDQYSLPGTALIRDVEPSHPKAEVAEIVAQEPVAPVKETPTDPLSVALQSGSGAAEVIETIKDTLSDSKLDRALSVLLDKVGSVLAQDLSFELVEPNQTGLPDVIQEEIKTARAVFDPSTETIYVRSTAYEVNGVRAETLAHELVHAAVNRLIQTKKKGARPEHVEKAIADTEKLMARAQELAQGRWAPAFENVSEFIAWGLTNPEFQRFLYTVKVPQRRSSKLMDGFRSLMNNILNILFGDNAVGNSEVMRTAIAQLYQNTGAILTGSQAVNEQAVQVRENLPVAPQRIGLMSALDIFEALGQRAPTRSNDRHQNHLRHLIGTLVTKARGPMGERLEELKSRFQDDADQYLHHVVHRTRPMVSLIRGAGFNMPAQDLFVLEQVEAVLKAGLDSHAQGRRELIRIFDKVKAKITVADFLPGLDINDPSNQDLVAEAQAKIDFIFTPRSEAEERRFDPAAGDEVTSTRSAYLHRFAGLALTYEPLRRAMNRIDLDAATEQEPINTLTDRILQVFNWVMDVVNGWITGQRKAPQAAKRIEQLMQRMVDVEYRTESQLAREMTKAADLANDKVSALVSRVNRAIERAAGSDTVRESRHKIIRGTGALVRVAAGDRADDFMEALGKVRNQFVEGRQGLLAHTITEMRGQTERNIPFHDLLRWTKHRVEQARKRINDWTRDSVLAEFSDSLTEDQETALSKALIKTDLGALVSTYTIAEIQNLIQDDDALDAEIKRHQTTLAREQHGMYYRNQSRMLGHYMATGSVKSPLLMFNAHNIAYLGGTELEADAQVAERTKPVIDRLASLWALKYTPKVYRDQAAQLVGEQNHRDGANGAEYLLHLHNKLKEESYRELFGHLDIHMVKGYTKEILNPYVSVEMAPLTGDRADELRARGFVPQPSAITRDPADPNVEPVYLWKNDNGGQTTLVSGVISTTNRVAKGTDIAHAKDQLGDDNAFTGTRRDVQTVTKRRAAAINQLFTSSVEMDPLLDQTNYMAPVLNHQGEVSNYRYLMKETTKDALLEKNNRVSRVMGALAGSIVDKREAEVMNEKAVEALFEQYQQDFDAEPGTYLRVAADSSDPALQEIYRMLPKETRDHIKEVWGQDHMLVRNDILTLMFGYRKFSIGDLWDKPAEQRKLYQQAFVTAAEMALGSQAASRLRGAERVLEELVKMTKDIFVIKNVLTLVGNIVSNFSVLFVAGVPVRSMLKWHQEGYNGIMRYQEDARKVFRLEQKLEVDRNLSPTERTKVQEEVVRLKNEIAVNPVKPLVDAGVFQSIIEDIEQENDDYSYKTRLVKATDKYTSLLPDRVKQVGKYALVTQDTLLYRFLNQSTQVSDFVARYAQYKHLTTRTRDRRSGEDAIREAVETFVNYDLPTHKAIQYGNDVGFIWYSRYYLRIQKVILKLFRDNPAKAIALIIGSNLMDFSNITNSSMLTNSPLNRFENPVSQMIDAPDEIAPINLATELM